MPVTLFAGLNKNLRNHVFQNLANILNFMQKYFAAELCNNMLSFKIFGITLYPLNSEISKFLFYGGGV